MERTKLLTITVIGLLLLNLATLGFLFLNGPKSQRPAHGGKLEPKEIIIEKLHFDANQQKKYDKLIAWHRGEITRLDDAIRKAKNDLYSELSKYSIDAQTKDSLISVINFNQKQIEEAHFQHFEDIKKLCHKDQMEDYTALTEELSKIFVPKPYRSRHD